MNYNTDYLLQRHDLIWLDTSFAMDEHFGVFIDAIAAQMEEIGQKIIVPEEVMAELFRHCESSNSVKNRAAGCAINTIRAYMSIFDVKEWLFNSIQIQRAFADRAILTELTAQRSGYAQALLTNDAKLCRDANNLNGQESVYGHPISVYKLKGSGELIYCKAESNEEKVQQLKVYIDRVREVPVTQVVYKEIEKPTERKVKWRTYLSIGGSFGIGFFVSKNANKISNQFGQIVNQVLKVLR